MTDNSSQSTSTLSASPIASIASTPSTASTDEQNQKATEEIDICSNYGNNKKLTFTTLTTMEKMNWPLKWDGWCLWDSHPFTTIPIPILRKDPLDDPNVFRIKDAVGWFCSPNCMKAYLLWLGGAHAYETLSQMRVILRNVLGIDQDYPQAPPREKLSVFHPSGPEKGMSIEEFRKGHIFKQYFIKCAPFIINSIVVQECPSQISQTNVRQSSTTSTSTSASTHPAHSNHSTHSTHSHHATHSTHPAHSLHQQQVQQVVPAGQTTFDEFYATYRATHGPPPALTNPTGKPKRTKTQSAQSAQSAQSVPLITDVVTDGDPSTTSPNGPSKKKSKTRVKKN